MHEHEHPAVVDATHGKAEKIADAQSDRHPHAANFASQNDAFAREFDVANTTVGAMIDRVEGHRKGMGVEPQGAARPGGSDPAC